MATRIGLAQQNGVSGVDADTICDSAAISACEKSQEWQLALGLLNRMAEAKFMRMTQARLEASSVHGGGRFSQRLGKPDMVGSRTIGAQQLMLEIALRQQGSSEYLRDSGRAEIFYLL